MIKGFFTSATFNKINYKSNEKTYWYLHKPSILSFQYTFASTINELLSKKAISIKENSTRWQLHYTKCLNLSNTFNRLIAC